MSERETLLRKLSAVQFAAWELHLYLDTHIDDPKAIAEHKKYTMKANELIKEFESKFGPLSPAAAETSSEWLANPWPWDYCKED